LLPHLVPELFDVTEHLMNERPPPSTVSLGFGITQKVKAYKAGDDAAPEVERRAKVMVVDNDAESRRFMQTRLSTANYAVEAVDTAQAGLDACVRTRPNLVIIDLHLDDMDGLALLKELKSRWPALVVIIVTAHGTIAQAVEATQCGAFGFLVKPVEKAELLGQVERAVAASTFTLAETDWRSQIVSRSQLMEDRLELANRAAGSDAPVLLTGENGTGKELLARAIHAASPRRDKLFVAVSCQDSAEGVLETELFGRRMDPRPDEATVSTGAIEAARGGTLLIDEIGDMPLRLQAELSSILEKNPGFRVICTTSRDLKVLIEAGTFRQELYYQINILPIEIPPLGRRREDIPLLVSHFLEQAKDDGGSRKIYSPEAIELLATTDWPGNVRQLFDLVKQNVALSHGKIITKEFVQKSLGKDSTSVPTYDEAREEFTLAYLKNNLQSTSGNVMQSARLAKRNRTDFYKLLARYRLQPDDFKGGSQQRDAGDDPAPPGRRGRAGTRPSANHSSSEGHGEGGH
jgi:two-component system response regulator GlrR